MISVMFFDVSMVVLATFGFCKKCLDFMTFATVEFRTNRFRKVAAFGDRVGAKLRTTEFVGVSNGLR